MLDYETLDYFTETDQAFLSDPHSYFEYLRAKGPVVRLPYRNTVAITGYEEAVQVMLDPEHFSSFTTATGPLIPLPFTPQGDDITEQLEAARKKMPMSNNVLTTDGERHVNLRSILSVLFTPRRMKEIEPVLRQSANAIIDEFIANGKVDMVTDYGHAFTTLVIADLFGLSEDGRQRIRRITERILDPANPLSTAEKLPEMFTSLAKELLRHIAKSRLKHSAPMKFLRKLVGMETKMDILGELATARFPDGTKPSLNDVVIAATTLFGAGLDTANRLIANSFKLLAQRPDLQNELRSNPARIVPFIEEMLRYEGSVKGASRICCRTTNLAGMEIKAGTHILLLHAAMNRDPRRFEDPLKFDIDRKKAKEHLGFGRGSHTCPGAQLARTEVRIAIEEFLKRADNIHLSEAKHGPEGHRHFVYEPHFLFYAVEHLYLEFDPR